MFPRTSPRGAAFEVSHDSVDVATLPPPPPPRNPSSGPDSRRHALRPPTLNTTVGYLPGPTHLNTPIVTPSSLSSPFAFSALAHGTSAGPVLSPGSRGVSPENHRLSGNFTNMSYNPQEWAAGRQATESRQRRDVYGEPLSTPPPPYVEQRGNSSTSFSHAAVTFSSPSVSLSSSPVIQHPTISTEPASYARPPRSNTTTPNPRPIYDTRRTTRMSSVVGPDYVPAQAYQQYVPQPGSLSFHADTSQLPPPPRRSPPNGVSNVEIDSHARLVYARRSTSAGPTPTADSSISRAVRTYSNGSHQPLSEQHPAVALPGPPPGPPPPSSRSRSAGREPESSLGVLRQRPPPLQIRNSNLAPIPATPVNAEPPSRASFFPLRIDTSGASVHGKAPATVPVEATDESQGPKGSAATLARRSAVRGFAPRSATQVRSRSKSIGKSDANELPPSSTLSTNPWASALEQANSPQHESLPEPSTLPITDASGQSGPSDVTRSHTPPITPSSMPHKTSAGQNRGAQQARVLPTPPLSQKPLLSANSLSAGTQLQNGFDQEDDIFVTEAVQRHAEFLKKEQGASTDLERLELFVSFMQQESLIRKDRYLIAFRSGSFDLEASKNMIFNGPKVRRASGRDSDIITNVVQSPGAASTGSATRNESNWWKDYRPALSTIASMEYDEEGSRGRAPSRWWESAGSQSDSNGQVVYRTKRESKYMGLSKKLLQNMENEMEPLCEEPSWPAQNVNEKANPETFGYYDEEVISPPLTARVQRNTLKASMLDISRFITLPPPYPRHFPAVNNNHPDLAEYRNTVRTLSDLEDAKNRQSRHKASVEAMRMDRKNKRSENRRKFRETIQSQIADGSLTYADAAEAEKYVQAEEHETERQGLQAEFDTLQDVVVNPLHEQLNGRIVQLGNSLQSLQQELFRSAANQDPDQPVQEGDDVPELLEQLTQLKWLFEAREMLHQELFNLLSQRNNAYKAIVALPYHQTNNLDKIRDTDAFFEKDAATRHATFCADALKRHEEFLQTIETNALRGVEMQSSAFWDITPGLVDLLQKIPSDLNKLDIHVPQEELQENPAYRQHPHQYLYLLLQHAQKSSYQFIEGQINLHCLVHEVKTSSLSAQYRASKAQQVMAGDRSVDLAETQREDERELTRELKSRATMIEEQWQDALGKQLETVKERVKKHLQKRGAWDDIAAEAGD